MAIMQVVIKKKATNKAIKTPKNQQMEITSPNLQETTTTKKIKTNLHYQVMISTSPAAIEGEK